MPRARARTYGPLGARPDGGMHYQLAIKRRRSNSAGSIVANSRCITLESLSGARARSLVVFLAFVPRAEDKARERDGENEEEEETDGEEHVAV